MPWFKTQMANEGKPATIDIIGPIGYKNWMDDSGVTFKEFKDAIDAMGDVTEIEVNLHSPGGDVWSGVPIYNLLRNHSAKITMRVLGEASSIASVILLAGDERIVPKNSVSLIHDVAGVLIGAFNVAELDKIKGQLEATREAILNVYEEHLKLSRDEILKLMLDDTYMTADEALEWGFATQIDEPLKMVASAEELKHNHEFFLMEVQLAAKEKEASALREKLGNVSAELGDTKEQLTKLQTPPVAADATQVIALCEAKGLESFAPQMIKAQLTEDQINQRLTVMESVKQVCVVAKVSPDLVMKHINNEADLLRTGINEALASAGVDIDNRIPLNNGGASTGKTIDPNKIYAQRRGN